MLTHEHRLIVAVALRMKAAFFDFSLAGETSSWVPIPKA
jgi:hypothetical protein